MRRLLLWSAALIWRYTMPKIPVVATVVATTNAMATRTAGDRKNSSIVVQHETGSTDIHDQRGAAPYVDLLAQIADVHVDDIGLEREVVVPHVLEQHRARDHLTGMAQEVLQKLEFARQQINPGASAMHRLFDQVHFKVANMQLRGAHVVEAAYQRFDPRGQLRHRERFAEIIVPSRLQAANPLVDGR